MENEDNRSVWRGNNRHRQSGSFHHLNLGHKLNQVSPNSLWCLEQAHSIILNDRIEGCIRGILTSRSICRAMFLRKSAIVFVSRELPRTPRLAPVCAGVSPGIRLAVAGAGRSSIASLSGAFVATFGSAMTARVRFESLLCSIVNVVFKSLEA